MQDRNTVQETSARTRLFDRLSFLNDMKYDQVVFLFSMPTGMVLCLIVGLVFWILKLLHVVTLLCKAFRIRGFYVHVLHIFDVSTIQNYYP